LFLFKVMLQSIVIFKIFRLFSFLGDFLLFQLSDFLLLKNVEISG
jgi:hypothetical protein